jgi:ferredoxin
VDKLDILPDTYIFALVTMGALGLGSVGALEAALKAKGNRLSYGRGVKAPANYVLMYNPADTEQRLKALEKADGLLRGYAAEISAGKQSVRKFPFTANNLYKDIEALDKGFTANDDCTGCGLCEKICPVRNIRLEGGNPQWLRHCEHCVACISWCPAKAINYADKTQSRRRYRNPFIKAGELTPDEE